MEKQKKGILISVEGIDGSGKSTLAKNLKDKLENDKLPVVLTYEPGDTDLGTHIRKILQERDFDMCGKSEFLLFASDRAQHFKDVIIPNLQKNNIVISDRMADSSLVYQGYGRYEDKQMIKAVNKWVMTNIVPDLTIYIKISVDLAMERLQKRKTIPTAFEKEKKEFTKRLEKGYKEIFKDRKNVIILDGTKTEGELTDTAYVQVKKWLNL